MLVRDCRFRVAAFRFPWVLWCLVAGLLLLPAVGMADGNRLAYLAENNPYYPSRTFARLTTPQWVGEEGVECVVVLAIDDMREPAKYEAYLRPILDRLKRIDGRAPVSIMTCNIDPASPQLQSWLREGLSLEIHTVDHPCPLLQKSDFPAAKSTYDRCVDLLMRVPGNKPVAFRMPCCDSLNTVSPRFYAEIFNRTTPGGHFLHMDSSVFNVFTSNDPSSPRELVIDDDGQEKFRKYLPADRTFVNTIEDYPYPYVINRVCWEFPCVTPSDWSAQHRQQPSNPVTVRDWKAALDLTVQKQGVFNLVFHPYNWIRAEQVVELIDHAVNRHGNKVKFLTFREAHERLVKNFLGGTPLRTATGDDAGVRVLDVDGDGFMDVVRLHATSPTTRRWNPHQRVWENVETPRCKLPADEFTPAGVQFGIIDKGGGATMLYGTEQVGLAATFRAGQWQLEGEDFQRLSGSVGHRLIVTAAGGRDAGVRFRDLDGDGRCELIITRGPISRGVFHWNDVFKSWERLAMLPDAAEAVDGEGRDAGLRFADLDDDGQEDLLVSSPAHVGVWLWDSAERGFTRRVADLERNQAEHALRDLPPFVRPDGSDNGAWFHSRHIFVQNEDTARLPDLVDRRSFNEILGAANLPPRALNPHQALRSLKPRPGFVVELVAAEPLVMDPVAIAFGPDGKLWVVEMADYPLGMDGQGKPGGRVRYLEDVNGDGQYERSTLFLENLPFPTGVMPWRNGVLVSAAPDVFYAEDTNGDGKADRRETLYTGFVEGNQQHRVNGFEWGLDNWIHLANGDSGGKIKSLKTGKEVSISGRDLRIRPDEGDIDPQTGQAQFGRHRDDWGNWFGNNNSNPLYHYVLADEYLRRNPHVAPPEPRVHVSDPPGAAPVFPVSRTPERFNDFDRANRFTSACSSMIYRDDLFGPAYAGNAFICEPVHNLVSRQVVRPRGITFTSQRAPDEARSEFLASTDSWFRPTMVQTGPDGALYVADMYRHVIEHPQWIPDHWQKRLDLRAGHDKGRIYRVYPIGRPPRAVPRMDTLSTAQLVAALDSPSGWQRDMAQQLLVQRRDGAAVVLLEQLATSKNPLARLHALCTLDGQGALTPAVLERALADEHPGVRRHAVRLCESLPTPPEPLLQKLAELAHDADATVRLQLAYTAANLGGQRGGAVVSALLRKDGGDIYHRAALLSSITRENIDSLLRDVLHHASGAERDRQLLAQLLSLAAALKSDSALATLLHEISQTPDGRFTTWQFAALQTLLETLDRKSVTLSSLAKTPHADLQQALARLPAVFAAARAVVKDDKATEADRAAAVAVLGREPRYLDTDLEVLGGLLTPRAGPALQQASIATLARLTHDDVPNIVLAHWAELGPTARTQVLDALLSREAWQRALLTAIESKNVEPHALDAVRRQRLLDSASRLVRQRAAKVLAATSSDRAAIVAQYQQALTLTPNLENGARLYEKTCAVCHPMAGKGHDVGPDLATVSDKSPEALLIAILDPNRAVEARYTAYTVLTKDGLTVTGLLSAETGASVTLKSQENKQVTVLRTDIEQLASNGKSIMPEGIEKDLKPQDVADIIGYVRSRVPLPKPKQFAGNSPSIVRPAADGTLTLDTSTCEIYGSTLIREEKYHNLGYWSSMDDHAVWRIEVPRDGKYAVHLDWACDNGTAHNTLALIVAGATALTWKVAGSGTWDDYKQAEIGTLELKAGPQRLVVRAAGRIQGSLIDLRSIKLVPSN